MKFQLVTLTGEKLNSDVYEVVIPTTGGEITVLPNHEPLITVAKTGVVKVRYQKEHSDDQFEYFAISGGVVEVSERGVKILVDEAEHGEEIIEADTQAALERAIRLRDSATDQIELEKAHQLVDRHAVRLKVAGLRRRHRERL